MSHFQAKLAACTFTNQNNMLFWRSQDATELLHEDLVLVSNNNILFNPYILLFYYEM